MSIQSFLLILERLDPHMHGADLRAAFVSVYQTMASGTEGSQSCAGRSTRASLDTFSDAGMPGRPRRRAKGEILARRDRIEDR